MSVRNWRIITYLSEEQINDVLSKKDTQIKAYAYILHDKDITEDGKAKPAHYHLLLGLHNGHTQRQLEKWFDDYTDESGKEINTFFKTLDNRKGAYGYLTHNTAKSQHKYQYSESEITAFNTNFFTTEIQEDTLNSAFEELLEGAKLNEVRKRYGRDFIIHYPKIKLLLQDILQH